MCHIYPLQCQSTITSSFHFLQDNTESTLYEERYWPKELFQMAYNHPNRTGIHEFHT
jgi:hypothetical protein